MERLRLAAILVGAHYAANLAHGAVHQGPPVPLTTPQLVFVILVIGVAPLGSLWLLGEEQPTWAWASLAAILLASFVFGVVFHYVVESPDLVANVTGLWHGAFAATALGVAIADGVGGVAAAWMAYRLFRIETSASGTAGQSIEGRE